MQNPGAAGHVPLDLVGNRLTDGLTRMKMKGIVSAEREHFLAIVAGSFGGRHGLRRQVTVFILLLHRGIAEPQRQKTIAQRHGGRAYVLQAAGIPRLQFRFPWQPQRLAERPEKILFRGQPGVQQVLHHRPLGLICVGDQLGHRLHVLGTAGFGCTEQHIIHAVGEGGHRWGRDETCRRDRGNRQDTGGFRSNGLTAQKYSPIRPARSRNRCWRSPAHWPAPGLRDG